MAGDDFNAFIPTTQIWDVEEIKKMDPSSSDFKELVTRMYQLLNQMAIGVNNREIAIYGTDEIPSGQTYFPNPQNGVTIDATAAPRGTYRKTFNFGALPNSGTTSLAHGITMTSGVTITRLYGAASNTTGYSYIPIPYVSAAGNVSLLANSTNIVITTTGNFSSYAITYIVIEYMKN